MSRMIHISQMRKMLTRGHKPVKLRVWTKSGRIEDMDGCVSLSYDFYSGTRRIKIVGSRQIRTVWDVCIFEINDLMVYI